MNLEKLTLTQNNLTIFKPTLEHYPSLNHLSLEQNAFTNFEFLDNLVHFDKLVHFRNRRCPIESLRSKDYLFQRTVA